MQIEEIIRKQKAKPIVIAQYFSEYLGHICVYNNDLYRYNGKFYELLESVNAGQEFVKFLTEHNMLDLWCLQREREVWAAIMRLPKTKTVEMDIYDNMINLRNGVLNLDTMELIPHNPDFHFSWNVDINYDPSAISAPEFTNFLSSTFNGDEETMETMIIIGGYLIYPMVKMEQMFVFLGSGANGKSTLINIYKLFFSKKFITSLSLMSLSGKNGGFSREQLINSRLNIASEEKEGKIDSEELKKIISGQDIDMSRKFKIGLNFTPKTKILVDSNGVPYFDDTTHGIKRRLIIINFVNRFVGGSEWKKVLELYGDPNKYGIFEGKNYDEMISKIKLELPAILNMFLAGLNKLRKLKWQIPISKHVQASMDEYEEVADSWKTWMENNYQFDNYQFDNDQYNFGVSFQQLYNEYDVWYQDNYRKNCPQSKIKFGRRLREYYKITPTIKTYRDNEGKVTTDTLFPLKRKEVVISENLNKLNF
jgi:putative DNA primase/helicase